MIPEEARRAATDELWRRGSLVYKLDSTQRKIYKAIQDGGRKHCLLCSRRLGKSFILVLVCLEYAIKNRNSRISYAAPTGRDASEIVSDLALHILDDCPEDMKPDYRVATKEYVFKNGSVVRFAGLNAEHADQLRGRAANLFVIDELGLVDDAKHVISDIALPMTLTTNGRLLFATTPPRSPGHDSTTIIKKMIQEKAVSTFTLLDNVRVSDSIKAEYLLEAGENPERIPDILAGKAMPETTTALREYWCELDVTDAETAVVPEFTTAVQKEICIAPEIPPYRDCYVAMDPGMQDKTGLLFSYYDYVAKKIVIEDELLLKRASTDTIGEAVKAKEAELWTRPPLRRVSDLDLRLIMDLTQNYGLVFQKAQRPDALGAMDLVRTLVRRRELIIHPRCTGLIRQLRNATWNRKASDFERTQEDAHFDLLAALKYLCRAIDRTKNPYPSWYGLGGFNASGPHQQKATKSVFSSTPLGRKLSKKWG